jgi:hypothetical protein
MFIELLSRVLGDTNNIAQNHTVQQHKNTTLKPEISKYLK